MIPANGRPIVKNWSQGKKMASRRRMEFSVVLEEGRPKSATRYLVVQGRDNGPLVQKL
jgi:hypothetical protein